MSKIELKKNIFWVGAIDWNVRNFHGYTYSTKRGTTYNAYLVLDDKIALVDTVMASFAEDLIKNIEAITDPLKIDYVIVNHVEDDHTGALPKILDIAKNAQVVCTKKCQEGLFRHYYKNWNFKIVKTGDSIFLGNKTLNFIETPMIHWPDSMFTYIPEDNLLLSNDAFGQHIASSERFDDEIDGCVLMEESEKYYANILIPLSFIISAKLSEIIKSGIKVDMIAPSHGIIWRNNPAQIIKAYSGWSSGLPLKKDILIVYETMWGATAKMASAMSAAIVDEGLKVKIYDINLGDHTEIIKDILNAKCLLIGSSTHDNHMLPNIAGFLGLIKGLKLKGRKAAAFGSYGWSGESAGHIEKLLAESGLKIINAPLTVKYVPSSQDIESCKDFGRRIAKEIISEE
ncbi:MAG: Nitric oxide reductase [Elusimicrobia bacterium ADurb.Bin231]|nr:MAG: Nitric oxide reductase [Elusimicrobia bacterium ADurb.Bin231]